MSMTQTSSAENKESHNIKNKVEQDAMHFLIQHKYDYYTGYNSAKEKLRAIRQIFLLMIEGLPNG